MKPEYVLSVVVPTKNRFLYLDEVLTTLVSFRDDRLEIVVEDNSDDPAVVAAIVSRLSWPHLKLNHSFEARSQTSNSEAAVRRASGTFVCFIGDDDCISNALVDACSALREAPIDCINFQRARFYWADVIFKGLRYPDLSLPTTSLLWREVGPGEALQRCLGSGAAKIEGLPRVYHGVVRRTVLDEVRSRFGSVFPGPSPDMASAIALSLTAKRFFECDLPLLVDGIGYDSAGGRGARGEHHAKLHEVAQLPPDVEDGWDLRIPRIWLGPTIWAQSCVTALRAGGRFDLIKQIKFPRLYALVLIFHPNCRREVFDVLKGGTFGLLAGTAFAVVDIVLWRVSRFIQNRLGRRFLSNGTSSFSCSSIASAVELIDGEVGDLVRSSIGKKFVDALQ